MSSAQTAETTASFQSQTHQETQDNLPALKHKLVTQALLYPSLSKTDVLCLDYLLARYNQKAGAAWPSLNKIAADLSISRRQAQKSVAKLKSHGFIFVLSGNRTQSNSYIPNFKRADGWTPGWCKKKSQDPPENQGFQSGEQPFPRVGNNRAPGVGNKCSPKPSLSEPLSKEPPLHAAAGSSSSSRPAPKKHEEIRLRPLTELEKEYQRLVAECLDLQGKIRTTKHALKQGIKKKILSGEIEITEEAVQEYRDQLGRLRAYKEQIEQTQMVNGVADEVIGKMAANEARKLLSEAMRGTSKTFIFHGREISLSAQTLVRIVGDKFPWLCKHKQEQQEKAGHDGESRADTLYRQTRFYFEQKENSEFLRTRFEQNLEKLRGVAPELAAEFD